MFLLIFSILTVFFLKVCDVSFNPMFQFSNGVLCKYNSYYNKYIICGCLHSNFSNCSLRFLRRRVLNISPYISMIYIMKQAEQNIYNTYFFVKKKEIEKVNNTSSPYMLKKSKCHNCLQVITFILIPDKYIW